MQAKTVKNMVISILCASILFIGVGYAYVQEENAKIQGQGAKNHLNVVFTNIEVKDDSDGSAISHKHMIDDSKKEADIDVEFTRAADQILYEVEVENKGNVDAVVRGINIKEKKQLDESGEEVAPTTDVTYTTEGLTSGAVIPSGSKATFTVLVRSSATEDVQIEKAATITLDYNVDYE